MATCNPVHSEEASGLYPEIVFSREEILTQLDRVIHSSHFRNSKRYPALLSFIVHQILDGNVDSLKERVLGIEVFGRTADYDTSADPVVRITAGEVRKRLAQYYQAPGHEHELRFDLPLGSYVPHFLSPATDMHAPSEPPADLGATSAQNAHPPELPSYAEPVVQAASSTAEISESPAHAPRMAVSRYSKSLRWKLAAALVLAAVTTAIGARWVLGEARNGIAFFWNPLLQTGRPPLVVLGVHSFDPTGKDLSPVTYASLPKAQQSMLASEIRSDMVPVSDIISYSALTNLLTSHGQTYHTESAAETTMSQLQQGPVILIGGFDNIWTVRLTDQLRYRLVTKTQNIQAVVDAQLPTRSWDFDKSQSATSSSRDYAIAGCFFDTQIEQYVLFAAGIGQHGTAVAAEFLTNDLALHKWVGQQHGAKGKNVEVVLATDILEGQHGPPHVVASEIW